MPIGMYSPLELSVSASCGSVRARKPPTMKQLVAPLRVSRKRSSNSSSAPGPAGGLDSAPGRAGEFAHAPVLVAVRLVVFVAARLWCGCRVAHETYLPEAGHIRRNIFPRAASPVAPEAEQEIPWHAVILSGGACRDEVLGHHTLDSTHVAMGVITDFNTWGQ